MPIRVAEIDAIGETPREETMTILAPLPPTLGPVELTVPNGWRSTASLRTDEHGITWDGSFVTYRDITSVSYATEERSLNLVQRQICRRVSLVGRHQSLDIRLGHTALGPKADVEHHHLYQMLVDVLHVRVEPRLRAELCRHVASGDPVCVAGLTIGRDGIRHEGSGHVVGWDRLPGAMFEANRVTVRAAGHQHDDLPWSAPMLAPNAVLLPELLADCAELFA